MTDKRGRNGRGDHRRDGYGAQLKMHILHQIIGGIDIAQLLRALAAQTG